jgi:hypothetical protein
MPFINGRYYMNPFYGAALERAREGEDNEGADQIPQQEPQFSDEVYHREPGGFHAGPQFSDGVYRSGPYTGHEESQLVELAHQQQGGTKQADQTRAAGKAHDSSTGHAQQGVTVYPHEKKIGALQVGGTTIRPTLWMESLPGRTVP